MRGPVNVASSGRADYQEQERSTNALGYGVAGTYFLFHKDLQTKLSYERTYHLPTDRELFGDGDYEDGNATLRPEKSDNLNFNLSYQHTFNDTHTLSVDAGFNYRYMQDYIKFFIVHTTKELVLTTVICRITSYVPLVRRV